MSEVGNEAKIIATSFELTGELEIELSETPEAYKESRRPSRRSRGTSRKLLLL